MYQDFQKLDKKLKEFQKIRNTDETSSILKFSAEVLSLIGHWKKDKIIYNLKAFRKPSK